MRRYLVVPFFVLLVACQNVANPVGTAETIEQKAYALAGLFQIVKGEAVDIVTRPDTPTEAVRVIRDADRAASGLVRPMVVVAREYSVARERMEAVRRAGGTPSVAAAEAVASALARLQNSFNQAKPAVDRFVAVVSGAKGG